MNKLQKTYYQAFLGTTFLCWSPLKPLVYFLPLMVVAWLLFNNLDKKLFSISKIFIFNIWLVIIGISILANNDFVIQNGFIAFLTYSSFLLFLIVPSKELASPELLRKMLKLTFIFLIVESMLGFVQGMYSFYRNRSFDLSTGDAVDGTIHPSLASTPTLANVMFAINLAFVLIFLVPFFSQFKIKKRLFIFLGAFTLLLASVMHVLIFTIISISIAYVVFNPGYIKFTFKQVMGLLIIVSIPVVLAINMLSTNVSLISYYFGRIIYGDTPKSQVVIRLFTEVPQEYPAVHIIGLGPGQFSSRASLIGTGLYFGSPANPKSLPLLTPEISQPLDHYIMDLWLWVSSLPYAAGSTLLPFASWISFYAEFGMLGFFALIITIAILFLLVRNRVKSVQKRRMAFAFGIAVLLLFFLGAQDNYWEVPQAIFIGLMFMKVYYGLLRDPSFNPEEHKLIG